MPDDLSVNPAGEISLPKPPIQHGPKWVFFGNDGLRAGWSALLFVVIFLALAVGFGTAIKLLHLPVPNTKGPASARWALAFEFVQMVLVLLATWIMARIETPQTRRLRLRRPSEAGALYLRGDLGFHRALRAGFRALEDAPACF